MRPLEPADTDALTVLDQAHAVEHGVRSMVSRASVHYFSRSGHSFVAELITNDPSSGNGPLGLILAHPVWAGSGAIVRIERLAVAVSSGRVAAVASALTAAVVKSAYDAGVYRLLAALPESDAVGMDALAASEFYQEASVVFELTLGSGGLSGSNPGGSNERSDDGSRRST